MSMSTIVRVHHRVALAFDVINRFHDAPPTSSPLS